MTALYILGGFLAGGVVVLGLVALYVWHVWREWY